MPRGRKPSKPINERIEEIDIQIAEHEAKIAELKNKKAKILDAKQQEEVKGLCKLMQDHNLSLEQLANLVENNNSGEVIQPEN